MAYERPRRLAPTKPTVRRLFAHSGNRCAFDPCDHPLIDEWGNFVGEVCHIRAALPEGERFDPAMTNEDRRAPDNLLLMCHRHHVETDDVERFDVFAMRRIKMRHEAQFAAEEAALTEEQVDQAVEYFVDSAIADRTFDTPFRVPTTCQAINATDGWHLEAEQGAETAREIAEYVRRLRRVPVDARAILSTVVDRGAAGGSVFDHSMSCLLVDVALATGIPQDDVIALVAVLDAWGIARLDWETDDRGLGQVIVRGMDVGWNMWQAVKEFAEGSGLTVRDFAVDLRFDLLDEVPPDA